MNRQTGAMPFYIDTTLVALGGIACFAAASMQLPVVYALLCGVLGFVAAGLMIGLLHRYSVSPGQLILGSHTRRSEKPAVAHAVMFTSSVAMTLLFMVGCVLFAFVHMHRLAFQ